MNQYIVDIFNIDINFSISKLNFCMLKKRLPTQKYMCLEKRKFLVICMVLWTNILFVYMYTVYYTVYVCILVVKISINNVISTVTTRLFWQKIVMNFHKKSLESANIHWNIDFLECWKIWMILYPRMRLKISSNQSELKEKVQNQKNLKRKLSRKIFQKVTLKSWNSAHYTYPGFHIKMVIKRYAYFYYYFCIKTYPSYSATITKVEITSSSWHLHNANFRNTRSVMKVNILFG